jgi:hypothetical protein
MCVSFTNSSLLFVNHGRDISVILLSERKVQSTFRPPRGALPSSDFFVMVAVSDNNQYVACLSKNGLVLVFTRSSSKYTFLQLSGLSTKRFVSVSFCSSDQLVLCEVPGDGSIHRAYVMSLQTGLQLVTFDITGSPVQTSSIVDNRVFALSNIASSSNVLLSQIQLYTPEGLFWHKIRHRSYQNALTLAERYHLPKSLVYADQALSQAADHQGVLPDNMMKEMLSNVPDDAFITAVADRLVCESLEATERLVAEALRRCEKHADEPVFRSTLSSLRMRRELISVLHGLSVPHKEKSSLLLFCCDFESLARHLVQQRQWACCAELRNLVKSRTPSIDWVRLLLEVSPTVDPDVYVGLLPRDAGSLEPFVRNMCDRMLALGLVDFALSLASLVDTLPLQAQIPTYRLAIVVRKLNYTFRQWIAMTPEHQFKLLVSHASVQTAVRQMASVGLEFLSLLPSEEVRKSVVRTFFSTHLELFLHCMEAAEIDSVLRPLLTDAGVADVLLQACAGDLLEGSGSDSLVYMAEELVQRLRASQSCERAMRLIGRAELRRRLRSARYETDVRNVAVELQRTTLRWEHVSANQPSGADVLSLSEEEMALWKLYEELLDKHTALFPSLFSSTLPQFVSSRLEQQMASLLDAGAQPEKINVIHRVLYKKDHPLVALSSRTGIELGKIVHYESLPYPDRKKVFVAREDIAFDEKFRTAVENEDLLFARALLSANVGNTNSAHLDMILANPSLMTRDMYDALLRTCQKNDVARLWSMRQSLGFVDTSSNNALSQFVKERSPEALSALLETQQVLDLGDAFWQSVEAQFPGNKKIEKFKKLQSTLLSLGLRSANLDDIAAALTRENVEKIARSAHRISLSSETIFRIFSVKFRTAEFLPLVKSLRELIGLFHGLFEEASEVQKESVVRKLVDMSKQKQSVDSVKDVDALGSCLAQFSASKVSQGCLAVLVVGLYAFHCTALKETTQHAFSALQTVFSLTGAPFPVINVLFAVSDLLAFDVEQRGLLLDVLADFHKGSSSSRSASSYGQACAERLACALVLDEGVDEAVQAVRSWPDTLRGWHHVLSTLFVKAGLLSRVAVPEDVALRIQGDLGDHVELIRMAAEQTVRGPNRTYHSLFNLS